MKNKTDEQGKAKRRCGTIQPNIDKYIMHIGFVSTRELII